MTVLSKTINLCNTTAKQNIYNIVFNNNTIHSVVNEVKNVVTIYYSDCWCGFFQKY